MPNVNDNQDVFYAHALQKWQKFLSAAFFIAIIVSFCHIGGLIAVNAILVISTTFRARCYAIGYDTAFSLCDTSFASHVVENKVNMSLVADSCGEGLELSTSSRFLLSKADRV